MFDSYRGRISRAGRIRTMLLLPALLVGSAWAGVGGHGHGDAHHHDGGAPASKQSIDRTIEVELRDIAFEPTRIEVSPGETVRFKLRNVGQMRHEFVLGDAEEQREHARQMRQSGHEGMHDHGNGVSLASGESGELIWQFGEPGTLEFACHEPGHYEAGMRGTIRID